MWIWTADAKVYSEGETPRRAGSTLKERNKVRGLTLLHFKTHHKAKWWWWKTDRQTNGIDPGKDTQKHTSRPLAFGQGTRPSKKAKMVLQYTVLEQLDICR